MVGAAVALLVGVGLTLVVVVRSAIDGDKVDGTVSRAKVLSATAPATAVSTNAQGIQGNGVSNSPAVSRDGTLVAFASSASVARREPRRGGRQRRVGHLRA